MDEPQRSATRHDRRLVAAPAAGRVDRPHRAVPGRRSAATTLAHGPGRQDRRARGRRRATGDDACRLSDLLRRDLAVRSRDHRRHRRQPQGRARAPVRRPAGHRRPTAAPSSPRPLSQGAAAVLAPRRRPRPGAPVLVTLGDVRRAYALAAARLLRRPAGDLRRRDRHQRQDLGRRLLPPDLRRLGRKAASMGTLGVVAQTGTEPKP